MEIDQQHFFYLCQEQNEMKIVWWVGKLFRPTSIVINVANHVSLCWMLGIHSALRPLCVWHTNNLHTHRLTQRHIQIGLFRWMSITIAQSMHNQCLLHPYSVSLYYYFRVVCECEQAGPLEINIVFTAAIHLIIPCPVLEVSIVFSLCVCVCVVGPEWMVPANMHKQKKRCCVDLWELR